jgi:hypothetical protein
MGYSIRWDEIAAPDVYEQPVSKGIERPAGLSRYFRKVIALTIAGSTVLVLTVVGGASIVLNGRQPTGLLLEAMPSSIEVSASTPQAIRRVGYVSVTGNLVNKTGRSLDRIEAVVELLDTNRRAVHSASAMVARNLITPGQTSAFQVEMADDPRATGYTVHFKKLYGADLK